MSEREQIIPEKSVTFKDFAEQDRLAIDAMVGRVGIDAVWKYVQSLRDADEKSHSKTPETVEVKDEVVDLRAKIKEAQSIIDGQVQELRQKLEGFAGSPEEQLALETQIKELTRPPGLYAYGGTQHAERRSVGGGWDLGGSTVGYNLGSERSTAFGVCHRGIRTYIMFQTILPHGERAYPYTVCIDPGPAVWEAYEHNGALLCYNLGMKINAHHDPKLVEQVYKEPEDFHRPEQIESGITAKTLYDQNIPPRVEPNPELMSILTNTKAQGAPVQETVITVGNAVEKLKSIVSAVQSLSVEQRKQATFMYTPGSSRSDRRPTYSFAQAHGIKTMIYGSYSEF